jgi:hypothetical protein
MTHPPKKPEKLKKIEEATFFLRNLEATNPKKRIQSENLQEKSLLQKYIESKKQQSEIEINDRKTYIDSRKTELKQKKYGIPPSETRIYPTSDREVPKLSLKINKLLHQIKNQEEEIKAKQVQIEKLRKPEKKFKYNYVESLKTLEDQLKAKESELYLLKYYQNNRDNPEKIEELMKTLNPLIIPEDSLISSQNLWLESGSQVGRSLQENYEKIKKIDEEIENAEKILNVPEEELLAEIRERREKEMEIVHAKFQRKKEKKLRDLGFLWEKELQSLRSVLNDLKQKSSLVYLRQIK